MKALIPIMMQPHPRYAGGCLRCAARSSVACVCASDRGAVVVSESYSPNVMKMLILVAVGECLFMFHYPTIYL